MANPQKENGYTSISNELVEAFAKYIPGHSEGRILFAILRKTYGWHKKSDSISINQIVELTGIGRRMVIYALQNLEAKNMIIIKRKRGRGHKNEVNQIGLQKNHEKWVVQEKSKQYRKVLQDRKDNYQKSKQKVVQEIEGSARNGKRVVQEMENNSEFLAPTKETITKETITKERSKIVFFDFDNGKWNISKDVYQKWKELFKDINIDVQLEKMKYWLINHNDARKKHEINKSFPIFVVNWLEKKEKELKKEGDFNGKDKPDYGKGNIKDKYKHLETRYSNLEK
jgi:phage replication O-like protein O